MARSKTKYRATKPKVDAVGSSTSSTERRSKGPEDDTWFYLRDALDRVKLFSPIDPWIKNPNPEQALLLWELIMPDIVPILFYKHSPNC